MSLALAIALVAMTSLAVAALLLPLLLRTGGTASRDAHNLAVYRDQLGEIERDAARGVLAGEQAEAARAEIGRRILALRQDDRASGSGIVANPRRVAAATVAILLLPIAALLLYAELGSPSLPDRPFADRRNNASPDTADAGDHIDVKTALSKLQDHLKTHPDDLTGWLLLARSRVALGDYAAGVEAYRRAVDLSGHRADIVGAWGEAQVLAAGGTVSPAAREAFAASLKDPETAPRSRYYLALAKMQQGDTAGALQAWRALAADSPADAVWLPIVNQRIAEATANLAGGAAGLPPAGAASPPSGDAAGTMPPPAAVSATAQAAAGLSPDERRAMIDTMVAKLAARLVRQPDDADGWAQLGRSYMVLHETAKARDAYTRAVRLRPNDAALREALAAADDAANAPSPK